MKSFVVPVLAGLLGSLAMTGLPARLGPFRLPRVDLVQAVGARLTRHRHAATRPGWALHLALGIGFGFLYHAVFASLHLPLNPATGVGAGALHGLLVALGSGALMSPYRVARRYPSPGWRPGLAQVFGHLVYGGTAGAVFAGADVLLS